MKGRNPSRIATIRDVAAAAGVSTATVSRTLAPDSSGRVSEKTRRRVFSAAATLEYRTNFAARSLKTRSTNTIAILAPELSNDFFMTMAEGMERELNARGYTLLVASSANSVEEEKKWTAMLTGRMVDGIVVIPAGSRGEHLTGRGVPVVLVDRLVEGIDLDAVLSDNEEGAYRLTRALLEDGCRRIAFVGGDQGISSARERLLGYKKALAEAGLQDGPVCLDGMGIEAGYRGMERILRSPEPAEALVAVNLLVHLGMQRCLLEQNPAGSRVSRPVIAAFDETVYTPFLPACRYTAVQEAAEMGKQAVQCILERIELKRRAGKVPAEAGAGNAEKRIIRFPVTIIRH
ncbi:MAG: LacI family transcriptional regulator [Treponema sp.]|jgi:LacI family transcriptional regulator|nr:LacI family transcriptional regulator [Treponema sp.]